MSHVLLQLHVVALEGVVLRGGGLQLAAHFVVVGLDGVVLHLDG